MALPEFRWLVPASESASRAGVSNLAELIARLEAERMVFPQRSAARLLEQLRSCGKRKPSRLICSLLDGDTDLPLQAVLGMREPAAIVRAVSMLKEFTGVRRAWIIGDAGLNADWTRELNQLANEVKIRTIFIRNNYPQSDPTLLVYTLLGSGMPPGVLATERGVLLLDAVSAWRIGSPMGAQATPMAVRDLVGNISYYAIVPVGSSLEQVLREMNISCKDRLIRLSDPLRDVRAGPDFEIDGSEVTVHLMPPESLINPDPCIRCGWCAEGCPVRIQPAGLLEAAQRNDRTLAEKFGLHACIECGICAYVCPSRLPLLQAIRSLRARGEDAKQVPAFVPIALRPGENGN